MRRFRSALRTIHPTVSSSHSLAEPDEPVFLDPRRSHRDRSSILHPFPKPEEPSDTFSHTEGTHRIIPHQTPGIAAHNLGFVDLTGKPIEDVISRVLRLDSAQSMSMTSLQCALLDEEETSFRKAVQCTTCPNPRHSSLECTLRTLPHLPLELYEYNLLNWNTVPVWQIEPQPA